MPRAASTEMPQMAQPPDCPTHHGPQRLSQNLQGPATTREGPFQHLKSSAGMWVSADQDYCHPKKAGEDLALRDQSLGPGFAS